LFDALPCFVGDNRVKSAVHFRPDAFIKLPAGFQFLGEAENSLPQYGHALSNGNSRLRAVDTNPVTKVTLDSASYDPNPPEGEELVRSGDKLVAVRKPAYSYSSR